MMQRKSWGTQLSRTSSNTVSIRRYLFQKRSFASETNSVVCSSTSRELDKHIPPAICEMYTCAKGLGKPTICAIYAESEKFHLLAPAPFPSLEQEVSRNMCTAISGIMAYWIEHSNEDIDANDNWFTLEWRDMKV
ncbi:hypothetical protein M378DRAFT_650123 [Amanita muscaria Koide BX008]|uniref:Uncharacterized protein n=1 Tax=Amanita muscaria (strain Koide BX008) TaxID=946122 RepID=A0A0C2X3L8_AMAMK|nr:hypothetical protein M378DRAFT_650123 [Amanita muscaria Koide BX008]